jgi:hypothetical protein
MTKRRSNNSSATMNQVVQWLNDMSGRSSAADTNIEKKADKDAGVPPDGGQNLSGDWIWFDQIAQPSNLYWTQEDAKLAYGGYHIGDETDADIALFGMAENPDNPGTKAVGVVGINPSIPLEFVTHYNGQARMQNVIFPMQTANQELFFPNAPPPLDGYTLNSTAGGTMYWAPPVSPPNVQDDTDITDVPVAVSPLTTLLPVSIVSNEASTSPAITISLRAFSSLNNAEFVTELLINGAPVPEAAAVSEVLPRNIGRDISHQWSPNQILIGDIVTVTVSSSQPNTVVQGSIEATVLVLIHPQGGAVKQTFTGVSVITPVSFWARWLDIEKENLMIYINHAPPGPLPSWIDVFRVSRMFASSHQNVNLASDYLIAEMAFIEAQGIIGPGRAATILAY